MRQLTKYQYDLIENWTKHACALIALATLSTLVYLYFTKRVGLPLVILGPIAGLLPYLVVYNQIVRGWLPRSYLYDSWWRSPGPAVLTFLNNRLPEEAYAYVNTSMQGHAQAQLEKVSCIEVDFAQARSLGLIVDSETLAHESKFYVFRSVGYSERGKLEIYHNEHALFASHRTEESNGKMRKFAVIAAVSGAYFSEAFSSCS